MDAAISPTCVTFWYALQNASKENGCLMVVRGSHRTTPLTRRCRANEHGLAEFVNLDKPVHAVLPTGLDEDSVEIKRDANGDYEYEKLEVKAGTLILMHGNLIHASAANRSSESRVAYTFGVVDGSLPWSRDAYLQPYEGEAEFEKLEHKA